MGNTPISAVRIELKSRGTTPESALKTDIMHEININPALSKRTKPTYLKII